MHRGNIYNISMLLFISMFLFACARFRNNLSTPLHIFFGFCLFFFFNVNQIYVKVFCLKKIIWLVFQILEKQTQNISHEKAHLIYVYLPLFPVTMYKCNKLQIWWFWADARHRWGIPSTYAYSCAHVHTHSRPTENEYTADSWSSDQTT